MKDQQNELVVSDIPFIRSSGRRGVNEQIFLISPNVLTFDCARSSAFHERQKRRVIGEHGDGNPGTGWDQ